ncbi:MAG: pyrroline-5-carboxylate reductase [Syntrophales bacterium]|jgi:pyrroline-5-carboxylate reductase|nr:pyrroline-5-carboxylate reductase [Syntrophales bacterium]MDY0044095.1 pyrroline-5-carboxylate reductase [Syntrophales bacterium]
MLKEKKIGIIGAGNMGEVLTKALISKCGIPPENIKIADVDASRLKDIERTYGIHTVAENSGASKGTDLLILAVKPQIMETVLEEISAELEASTLVISIAAGFTIHNIEERLGSSCRIIRVMPNTPAMIGFGASALAAGKNILKRDMEMARRIFDSVGITVTVDESLMDAVTGLSGSGPAYGFIVIEALTDAGVSMGLSRDISLKLASQTMLGAAKLCLEGEKTPSQLKDMVTSPAGTTIEGIKALERAGLRAALINAVEAATQRSRKLGGKKID